MLNITDDKFLQPFREVISACRYLVDVSSFLAHLSKGNVSFCHHLASVVCLLFIRNKNCLCWPCLLMNRAEMSNLYREPSLDASNQASVYLAKRFQSRRFYGRSSIKIAQNRMKGEQQRLGPLSL
jgi:hypothetical protein